MDAKQEAPIKRSVEDVFRDFRGRRDGLIKALTTDFEKFCQECDPEDNLCLYGLPNGSWEVNVPVDEVPPELPEPILGINFAKEGMCTSEWISLVAIHSDAWLISLAFYFGARFMFDKNDRKRLFQKINGLPNVFEVVTAKQPEQLSTNQSNVFEVVTAKHPEQLSTNQSSGFEVVTAKQPERLSTNQSNGFEVVKPEQLSTNQRNGFEVVTAKQPEQMSTNQSNGNRSKPSGKMPQSRSFEPQPKRVNMSPPPKEDGDSDEEEADEQGTSCGACGDDNDVDEFWICCDVCEIWFHGQCVKITPAKAKHIDQYKCPSCSKKKARVH